MTNAKIWDHMDDDERIKALKKVMSKEFEEYPQLNFFNSDELSRADLGKLVRAHKGL